MTTGAATKMPTGASTKLTQAQTLVAIADFAEAFRGIDWDTAYATVEINGHKETRPVRSKGFRRWLVGRFYELEHKPPSQQALQDAIGLIEARAQFGDAVHAVAVRIAGDDGAVYLDLANETWEAVEISSTGWRIVSDAPVKFRRPKGMQALPRPVAGGSIEALRRFVNVADAAAFVLLVGWAVGALRPRGPYGVLVLNGEQGAAKSTTVRVLRRLIDPNVADLRSEPADARDLMIAAANTWMTALDNVSSLSTWLSDALCRLASGGGFATRELYTDAEEAIFDAQRPVVVNGIDEIVTRSDLMDRSLIVVLPVIKEESRRPEAEFWAEFEAARPLLLGALLDAVSTALRRQADVRLPRLPRMADLAIWVEAAAPALGWKKGAFVRAYDGNRTFAHELVLESSPVAAAVRDLADAGPWSGTATKLLAVLNDRADEATRRMHGWPKRANHLAGTLRRLGPNLRAVGVALAFEDRPELGRERRQVVISRKVEADDRSDRSERSGEGFDRSGDAGDRSGDRSAERSGCSAERSPRDDTPRQNDGNDPNDGIRTLSGQPVWGPAGPDGQRARQPGLGLTAPPAPENAAPAHPEACDGEGRVQLESEAELKEWTA